MAVGSDKASNQHFDVITQLNDGIRLLQGQGHNGSKTASAIQLCHTSCDLKDGGSLEAYLSQVKSWLENNPDEVITLLWVNSDKVPATSWARAYESTGMAGLSYRPPSYRAAWPPLSTMIASGRRVVNFITSGKDYVNVPYLLDEFDYMWETPYQNMSPDNFTCELDRGDTANPIFLANHFVYTTTKIFSVSFDSPDTDRIDKTNSVANVQAHANQCAGIYKRYPTFLLVDFYEKGSGGVFQAAALMNGVAYVQKAFTTAANPNLITDLYSPGEHQMRNILITGGIGIFVLIATISTCVCCVRCCRRGRGYKEVESNRLYQNRVSQQLVKTPLEDYELVEPKSHGYAPPDAYSRNAVPQRPDVPWATNMPAYPPSSSDRYEAPRSNRAPYQPYGYR